MILSIPNTGPKISIDLSNPIKVEAAEGFTLSELLENKREVEKRKMERMGC